MIVVEPELTPVTTPVEGLTVAAVALVELHVPPVVPVASDSWMVLPLHTVVAPVIAPAVDGAFTLIVYGTVCKVPVPQVLFTV